MEHYIVTEASSFRLNPPGGFLIYKNPSGTPIRESLIEGEKVDKNIPYSLLNPLQSLFFMKYKQGNALITAPTSAGKSLIAFLFMKRKGIKIYTAPTKALVYEKALELRKLFGKKIDIRTGDIIETYKNPRSEIIVSTYENFTLALRNKIKWATEACCVVIDEIHHLIGSRGWILEELVTYLLESATDILGLSATLPGSIELAKWIGAELYIESLWRPTPLERKIIPLTEFKEMVKTKDREEKMASRLLSALFELKKPGDQVILFVHKKNIGWRILELANREKIGIMNETTPFEREEREEKEIAFHNADIPKEEREEIEKAFRKGELPVLIATHTLAYGVNLPADTVIISVKAFYERQTYRWKIFPSQLDILQMEGRAGRLGIKEKGYSYILPYGAKVQTLEREIKESLEGEFKPFLKESITSGASFKEVEKILSLFILIGFLYEGKNFKRFLRKTFSLRELSEDITVDRIYEYLVERGYIEGNRLSDKALFCIRSGISPVNYEEFLRRKLIGLEDIVVVRPLIFVKRFDSLYEFVKEGRSFKEDDVYVRNKLLPCGRECLEDNTHQFLFYIEGLTFKYRNIQNPPGEFSYLGTDTLHLIRTLLEIRKLGDIDWTNRKILKIAHAIKYGLTQDYAPLGGIKGIGHIRANLLKRLLSEEGLKPPDLGESVENFLQYLKGSLVGTLEERIKDILKTYRYIEDNEKVNKEAKQILSRLEGNKGGMLTDDRILRTFGMFYLGVEALRMKKKDLLRRVLEE